MKKFRVTAVQSVPLKVGVKLEEFDEDEETYVGYISLL